MMLFPIKDDIQMSIGAFGETSPRGKMKIVRKNRGPSDVLKSAAPLS